MKNVGNHRKTSEGGSRGTPGSEDAYTTLQKNYNDLLREHSRALIAVDQLRVAKYLARPRAYQSKVISFVIIFICFSLAFVEQQLFTMMLIASYSIVLNQ